MIEIIKKLIRTKEKRLKNKLEQLVILLNIKNRSFVRVPVRVNSPKNPFK